MADKGKGRASEAPNVEIINCLDELKMFRSLAGYCDPRGLRRDVELSTATSGQLCSYIIDRLLGLSALQEISLLEAFWEDFDGWTAQDFEKADNRFINKLVDTLRTRGIYTGAHPTKKAVQLYELLANKVYPEWPADKLMSITFVPGVQVIKQSSTPSPPVNPGEVYDPERVILPSGPGTTPPLAVQGNDKARPGEQADPSAQLGAPSNSREDGAAAAATLSQRSPSANPDAPAPTQGPAKQYSDAHREPNRLSQPHVPKSEKHSPRQMSSHQQAQGAQQQPLEWQAGQSSLSRQAGQPPPGGQVGQSLGRQAGQPQERMESGPQVAGMPPTQRNMGYPDADYETRYGMAEPTGMAGTEQHGGRTYPHGTWEQGRGPRNQYDSRELRPTRWLIPPSRHPRAHGGIGSMAYASFSKTWRSEKSYSGAAYEVLDDSIRALYNVCQGLEIGQQHLHQLVGLVLTKEASSFYTTNLEHLDLDFATIYGRLDSHFNTIVHRKRYYNDWTHATLRRKPDESLGDTFRTMVERLRLLQRLMAPQYDGDGPLHNAIINACKMFPELKPALWNPDPTVEGLCITLYMALDMAEEPDGAHLTERQYRQGAARGSRGYNRGFSQRGRDFRGYRGDTSTGGSRSENRPLTRETTRDRGRCWICGQEGCRSHQHPQAEQDAQKRRWRERQREQGHSAKGYRQYVTDFEAGSQDVPSSDDEGDDGSEGSEGNGADDLPGDSAHHAETASYLCDEAFLHRMTGMTIALPPGKVPTATSQFVLDRYTRSRFQGILPDTGAAAHSTIGYGQYEALQRRDGVVIDSSDAGAVSIRFGDGKPRESIGSISVQTPVGEVRFHVLHAGTPALMAVKDMNALNVELRNTSDTLVKLNADGEVTASVPVVWKWGHPWFHGDHFEAHYLTETELRRVHRRFGHPAVGRLHRLLKAAGHGDTKYETIEQMQKVCRYCQLHDHAPRRFKFTLRDDESYNYEVFADILWVKAGPATRKVLHLVDSATAYQAGTFLTGMTAADVWEAVMKCWIATYLGPPDRITTDAGSNFAAKEFKAEAAHLGIVCQEVPTEAHNSIGKVERYHQPLRRAWDCLYAELGSSYQEATILQMAFKAVNDTAGPDGLVPTLLVFGAYPRLTTSSPPSASTKRRAEAVAKAMATVAELKASRQVADALGTRNGPNLTHLLGMKPGDRVRVFYDGGKGWKGPLTVAAVSGTTVTVDNGASHGKRYSDFRGTKVRPWYDDPAEDKPTATVPLLSRSMSTSQNPFRAADSESAMRARAAQPSWFTQLPCSAYLGCSSGEAEAFLTPKERADMELCLRLRREGVITAAGPPFEASDAAEINSLLANGVIKPLLFRPELRKTGQFFKSRIVREIKGKALGATPYEKSRLIVRGFSDDGKAGILTQSPTIMRCSQRLICALAPTLMEMGMKMASRDITQAYPQSREALHRPIFVHLPAELKPRYPAGTILQVVRPLYGIAEAGVHWFATYQAHHLEALGMRTSCYDPCLLISKDNDAFGMVGLQTDDTLYVATDEFLAREQTELDKAGFKAKTRTEISAQTGSEDFNGARITVEATGSILVQQKGQADKLALANDASSYVEQRARGAYLATLCQPEASFDFSVAAQAQEPTAEDYKRLNDRIQWQITNKTRGLRYLPLKITGIKVMVFADGSFANNKDLSSQIGWIVVIGTEEFHGLPRGGNGETDSAKSFTLTGNVVHWSSTKCKRVTRSVLASEIYGLVGGTDLGFVLHKTVETVTKAVGARQLVPLVACTDSYSLYECLVKLGTTEEKRLMIDVMALRQSYEAREISEIRWIAGDDNPADAFTKAKSNGALRTLIDHNRLHIRLEGWVRRPSAPLPPVSAASAGKPAETSSEKTSSEKTSSTP